MSPVPKSVETPSYHVWTDAVHARELARQTTSDWDRGSYVRSCIVSAWTAFEMTCEDSLGVRGLGNRFKENLDKAIEAKGLVAIDWGSGLWQEVLEIYQLRIDYVHRAVPQTRLLAPVEEAERAISVLRQAVKDVTKRSGAPAPGWVDHDLDKGWANTMFGQVHVKVVRAGVEEDDPEAIRVAYVYKGEEKVSEVLPPGTDPEPTLQRLLEELAIPVSAVRAYRGEKLLKEITVRMRE